MTVSGTKVALDSALTPLGTAGMKQPPYWLGRLSPPDPDRFTGLGMFEPRHPDDEYGNESPRATVASLREHGMTTVSAFCEANGCHYVALAPLERRPDEIPAPDMALKLRCSKCDSRHVKMMVNVDELYAMAHGTRFKCNGPAPSPRPKHYPWVARPQARRPPMAPKGSEGTRSSRRPR
jgi:hypothetical protein